MAYDRKDHFYKRAKREGKASRAVYKFSELQKRFRLISRGDIILELGTAPGSWMKEFSELVGPRGLVIGIDLLPLKIELPKNCFFIRGDAKAEESSNAIEERAHEGIDAVFSDLSPNLSGISFADTHRSYELSLMAFDLCRKFLKPGGNFVVKIFPGDEFHGYITLLRRHFKEVKAVVPEATRKTSSERYIVAKGYLG